jgi:hypothetical protein
MLYLSMFQLLRRPLRAIPGKNGGVGGLDSTFFHHPPPINFYFLYTPPPTQYDLLQPMLFALYLDILIPLTSIIEVRMVPQNAARFILFV